MFNRSKRFKFFALASLGVIATALAVETITVQVQRLDVWAKKGSMFGTVATLKKDETLQVLEKLDGGWMRVSASGKEGFVKDTALIPPKNGGFGDAFKGINVGRTDAADATASNAARGLKDGATVYAKAKNYRTDGLEEMISAREAVSGPRIMEFMTQGNVGPAQK